MHCNKQELLDYFENDLKNNCENNAWNLEHTPSCNVIILQEILNRIMQGIMSTITLALVGRWQGSVRQRLHQHWKQLNGIHYWCYFYLHISHRAARSMAKLISQSCGKLKAAVLLFNGRGSHLKTTQVLMDIWKASETSHSKSNLDHLQYQYLPELVANVKSMSCCCVHGRQIIPNLVTYIVVCHLNTSRERAAFKQNINYIETNQYKW